ncbi:hypothetical protein ACF0H5_008658 [Mactra antiquata]
MDFETTPAPSTDNDDFDLVRLVWIVPLAIGVIAILVGLALLLFFCIHRSELYCVKKCSCCCKDTVKYNDEYLHLNQAFGMSNDNYSLNGL